MRNPRRTPVLAVLLPLVLAGVGCNLVKAKAAFKEGNARYQEEKYRDAVKAYEHAVELKPDFAEAHFYLASAHQSLYRPAKGEDAENRSHLDTAIAHYEKSLEVNPADTKERKELRMNALGALTTIYSEPPMQNYDKALSYAEQIVRDNPNDTKNLYAMGGLYERFNRVAEAEQTYKRVVEQNPSDAKACGALAAFYNKTYWDEKGEIFVEKQSKGSPRARFDLAIDTLQRCASLDPSDASGFQKVATFYWSKAYRDPLLNDQEKNAYADKGIEAVNKALEIKPDYWEAIIYKNLLFRVKAQVTTSPAERKQYLDQAMLLQKQAYDLRKEQQASSSGGDVPAEAAEAPKS